MEIKVYYEDTDCGGVVYYANYLKYFERARTEYLETRGCSIADWMQRGVVFVVVHAEAHYYSAGRYGETLTIESQWSRPRLHQNRLPHQRRWQPTRARRVDAPLG
jgi:acyl-CoA thioester hydrolase